jgi:hypothetical protein
MTLHAQCDFEFTNGSVGSFARCVFARLPAAPSISEKEEKSRDQYTVQLS